MNAELLDNDAERHNSTMERVCDKALDILMQIVAWPIYAQQFEETVLSMTRKMIEEVNRT